MNAKTRKGKGKHSPARLLSVRRRGGGHDIGTRRSHAEQKTRSWSCSWMRRRDRERGRRPLPPGRPWMPSSVARQAGRDEAGGAAEGITGGFALWALGFHHRALRILIRPRGVFFLFLKSRPQLRRISKITLRLPPRRKLNSTLNPE